MLVLALGFTCGIIGIIIVLIINLLLSHGKQRPVQYLVAFLACICGYSLHPFFKWELLIQPGNRDLLSFFSLSESQFYLAFSTMWIFSEMVPWTVWIFLRTVCKDKADSLKIAALPLIIITLINIFVVVSHFEKPTQLYLSNALNFILLILAMHEVLYDIRADLSNKRRQFRNAVFLFLLLEILFIFYLETTVPLWSSAGWLFGTRLIVFFACLLVSTLYFQASHDSITELFYLNKPVEQPTSLKLSSHADELIHTIETEKLFQDPNLSVASMAKRMSIPEPKLRDLILKELGYRNFNAFINTFRVTYAAQRLQSNRDTPISTILTDSGFKSHPPFNRAFRELHGVSPAEYRVNLKTHSPNRIQGKPERNMS